MTRSSKSRAARRRVEKQKQRSPRGHIDATRLIDVHLVNGETAWVHSHGLQALGYAELEIRDIPRFLGRPAGQIVNAVASYLLNAERRVRVDDIIAIDGLGVVQVREAVPQPDVIEGHYDHERWTIVDAPESCNECEICRAMALGLI